MGTFGAQNKKSKYFCLYSGDTCKVNQKLTVNYGLRWEPFMPQQLVNGAVYPFVDVKRQPVRFRVVNGSQARFYNLALYYAKTAPDGAAIPDLTRPGPQFYQIGTEGGLLQGHHRLFLFSGWVLSRRGGVCVRPLYRCERPIVCRGSVLLKWQLVPLR
jgi:FtsP/CotA-like multicopper oxidase with cupredoxin domain